MTRAGIPTFAAQEETRLALAAAAARAERQNQPKVLLYAAGLLLLAALLFLGITFRASLAAASDLKTQKRQAQETIDQAGLLKALHEAAAAAPELVQPATQVLSRIEQAGVDAGLKNKVPIPRPRFETPPGLGSKQTRLDYEIRDESLPRMLDWMERAVAEVPGLEVYSVSLKPETHQWILRVTFSRWERTEGT